MIASITCSLILLLLYGISRWEAAVPLVRTLSASIDNWADSVQGQEPERLT